MPGILLSLILFLQGIPVQQGGTVTGVLRDSKGLPAAGVRMAAVARGDVIENTAGGSMAGITETDAQGRFTLENIPPGRYAIAAGRLDLQTYYPGTQVLADATVLTITGATRVTDIKFVLNDTSVGRAYDPFSSAVQAYYSAVQLQPFAATIPVAVRVENGGKLPVAANGREVSMALSSASDNFTYPINATAVSIPGPLSGDFSVKVDGLPPTHKVKRITYGSTDITNSTFPLSAANFSTQSTLPAQSTIRSITVTGTTVMINMFVGPAPTVAAPPSTLTITLDYVAPPKSAGVRVTGTVGTGETPSVYISGIPGVVFSDRSFEFHGVPPGRHLIAAPHRFTPKAAVIVVGDRDIDGVQLTRTLAQPDITVPQSIPPAGAVAPGTVIPLPRILGSVVEEATSMPIVNGMIIVENEDYKRTFSTDSSGRFESFALFPGNYDVSLWLFGHVATTKRVTIEDKDLQVKLSVNSED